MEREAVRRLIPVDQSADVLRWAIEARELAECLDVDLPTLQARLDYLSDHERNYLEEVAAPRQEKSWGLAGRACAH